MFTWASLAVIGLTILPGAQARGQGLFPVDPAYEKPLLIHSSSSEEIAPMDPPITVLESTRNSSLPIAAPAPEREGCEISGGLELKDNSQGVGMGYQEHPPVQNIGECWTLGLTALKKQLSRCQAPHEFFVRMQFKKGPKLLRDERRGVCKGENRNIASEPSSGELIAPIPSKGPMKMRRKKRWHHVNEPYPNEAQPALPQDAIKDQSLPTAEGL